MTGKSTVEEGAMKVVFDFPGFVARKWLKNPCDPSEVRVNGIDMKVECPKFDQGGKDGFTIEVTNNEPLDFYKVKSTSKRIKIDVRNGRFFLFLNVLNFFRMTALNLIDR